MQFTIHMPRVESCAATGCGYNAGGECHARAITIGDGVHAACDTYLVAEGHQPVRREPAGVGACKLEGCVHNHDFECEAQAVRLQIHDNHADCSTYSLA